MRWFTHQLRRARGRRLYGVASIVALVALLVLWRSAHGAPYVNPFWTNGSPSQESAIPYAADLSTSSEGVGCNEILSALTV